MKAETLYIVVEGKNDAGCLRRLLPRRILARCEFVVAQGKSSAISDARTLLVVSETPVALVVNSDTEEVEAVAQERDTLEQLLPTTSRYSNSGVFLAVPTLDALARRYNTVNQIPLVKDLVQFADAVTEARRAREAVLDH